MSPPKPKGFLIPRSVAFGIVLLVVVVAAVASTYFLTTTYQGSRLIISTVTQTSIHTQLSWSTVVTQQQSTTESTSQQTQTQTAQTPTYEVYCYVLNNPYCMPAIKAPPGQTCWMVSNDEYCAPPYYGQDPLTSVDGEMADTGLLYSHGCFIGLTNVPKGNYVGENVAVGGYATLNTNQNTQCPIRNVYVISFSAAGMPPFD